MTNRGVLIGSQEHRDAVERGHAKRAAHKSSIMSDLRNAATEQAANVQRTREQIARARPGHIFPGNNPAKHVTPARGTGTTYPPKGHPGKARTVD